MKLSQIKMISLQNVLLIYLQLEKKNIGFNRVKQFSRPTKLSQDNFIFLFQNFSCVLVMDRITATATAVNRMLV